MLDILSLRNDLDGVTTRLASRGVMLDRERFRVLEDERKALQTRTQDLQAKRNALSKQIGQLKSRGDNAEALLAEVAGLGGELTDCEGKLAALLARINDYLALIPNLPHASVPHGTSEADNAEVLRWGKPRAFDFAPKDHVDLGAGLGGLDFETATKIAGSRFALMSGPIARLHRALAQFMLDTHSLEHGYTEVYVPYLVNPQSMFGTGQLPKFEEDLCRVPRSDGSHL